MPSREPSRPWEEIAYGTDLLFYEGLHGATVTDKVNIAKYADLKIGVVPVINLEWIQKIHRDPRGSRLFNGDDVTPRFCAACRTT